MFKNLTTFSYKRNLKEAIGFYLACLLGAFILSIILGATGIVKAPPEAQSVSSAFSEGFRSGSSVVTMTLTMYCLIIACLVLVQRRLYKNFGYVILMLLNVIITFFGGLVLGLIIPAFMTTREIFSAETQTT